MSDTDSHAADAAASVIDGLAKRYDNDPLCDFKIKCGEREWNVHKVILAMHSPVLAVAATKDLKESKQGFIDLFEDDPECIQKLVCYLYKLKYDLDIQSNPEIHVKMCVLADKYDIPSLRVLAIDNFKQVVTAEKLCMSQQGPFCEAVKCAYRTPDATKTIRGEMAGHMVKHDVLGYVSSNPSSDLAILLRGHGEVLYGVALALRERLAFVKSQPKMIACRLCKNWHEEGYLC